MAISMMLAVVTLTVFLVKPAVSPLPFIVELFMATHVMRVIAMIVLVIRVVVALSVFIVELIVPPPAHFMTIIVTVVPFFVMPYITLLVMLVMMPLSIVIHTMRALVRMLALG